MNLTETPLSQEYKYKGRIINLRVDEARLPNGAKATREVIEHPGGVCVAALTDEGELLFVRQFRYPYQRLTLNDEIKKCRYPYQEVIPEIPAGKLTPGEDPLECGKRELQEETGAAAARYEFLGKLYPSPGYCGEIIYMYMATGLTYGEMNPDEDEFLEVERIPLEKAAAMVLDGTITDAKTQAAVLKVYIKAKG